jgi:hypothetical protein
MNRLRIFALLAVGSFACNGILGIEEASFDPTFSPDAGEADARSSGSRATCAQYCAAIMKNCTKEHAQYVSAATCEDMCPGFLANGQPQGDTLDCRMQAAEAAAGNPGVECPTAGPFGHTKCSGLEDAKQCDPFCRLTVALCAADG